MISLSNLQDEFQRALLEGNDKVLSRIPDSPKENRETLLEVYRNAYVLRLIEFIEHDHECLHAYLGDEGFDAMARAYVAAHPSDQPNARWFARHLPEFLRTADGYKDHPQLAEIATIEKALNDAFDRADGPVLSLDGLSGIAPEDWPLLSFSAHNAAQRFTFSTNAFALWLALQNEEEPPDVEARPDGEHVIVWREGTMPKVRVFGPEEAMMWTEAVKGVRFGVLCEMCATFDEPDEAAGRAATYLQSWLTTGMLATAEVSSGK